ncbi:dihydrofolate reductase family protein [Aestuariispira insulae]|uniref:Dihydrofolate reductase n=1 Tax=Aestuariispira insulae TaxID=1461337 RepID=A0A3D9HY84_9PROT|nr:dihydrofolate reductase family protein [Aestuariispira insulae]RED54380.1 dihydrofolate reductase [Aestuariispira insulae]
MCTGFVFMACSLDGFVARPDHSLDWLMPFNSAHEDHGYDDFISRMDGIVLGRATFEKVLGFGDWPYRLPVMVMSGNLTIDSIPPELRDRVQIGRQSPAGTMATLAEKGWRQVYVDGGRLVRSFLRDGLISEITLTIAPLLIGSGLPLFGHDGDDIILELLDSRTFKSGLVQHHYRLDNASRKED